MKKIWGGGGAVLLLLALTGCSGNNEWSRPVGIIVVHGEAVSEDGGNICAVNEEGQYSFPLDAAMAYYFDAGDEQSFAGDQNVTFLRYAVNTDTGTMSAEAEAEFVPVEGAENNLFAYNLYWDGEKLFFRPAPLLSVDMDAATESITVSPHDSQFRMTVKHGTPVDFFNVTARKGEEELLFETLRPADMQDFMKLTLPEGTDNVEITAFDADCEYIGRRSFMYGEGSYSVGYDVGGRFLGGKTLNLAWPDIYGITGGAGR